MKKYLSIALILVGCGHDAGVLNDEDYLKTIREQNGIIAQQDSIIKNMKTEKSVIAEINEASIHSERLGKGNGLMNQANKMLRNGIRAGGAGQVDSMWYFSGKADAFKESAQIVYKP